MKYYLVALFDKQSYSYIEGIQKNICKKYRAYKNTPVLHVTLEVIGDPDVEKLGKVVSDILKPYKKFKVEINGLMSLDPPYKNLNLKIENKGYIIRLARKINDALKLHGFDVRDTIANLDLHISLGNTNHVVKEWTAREYVAACDSTKNRDIYSMAKIDRIELWKQVSNKKDMIVKTFLLRDY